MTQNPYVIRVVRPGDRETALHESAHAVLAASRGLAIDCVELRCEEFEPDVLSRGRLHFAPQRGAVRSLDLICVYLAGGEAERVAFGFVAHEGDRVDVALAREELARIHGVAPSDAVVDEMLEVCRSETADSVKQNWLWIERVAVALRRHRVLNMEAIERLRPRAAPAAGTPDTDTTAGSVMTTAAAEATETGGTR